jgi:dynein heavy chain
VVQEKRLEVCSGDVMLSAAFISYIGPFSKVHRKNVMKEFIKFTTENKIPISENFDPIGVFADAATVSEWNNNFLPADKTSSENGMILMNSERWPLIIDPQLQGIRWLKHQFASNLLNLKMTDKGWKNDLFNGIESGKIIVFENLEEKIDATIQPVIGRNYIKRGSNRVLKIGDRELNVHVDFRM